MTRHKDVAANVRLRRTLTLGLSAEFDLLADAVLEAQDGDIILVAPGVYTAPSQYPSSLNDIVIDGKSLTISGTDPHNEAMIRSTVFDSYSFELLNMDETTVFEGVTLRASQMDLNKADILIRNCIFSECQFEMVHEFHLPPVPGGADGIISTRSSVVLWNLVESSPQITSCIFENNSVEGAYGENGFQGTQQHPDGGDGGWPSPTYGGAVYCGFNSDPTFTNCRFTGNEAIGAPGGRGADFVTINNVRYYGGRGGGWEYDEINEQYLIETIGWDGWIYQAEGTKYNPDYFSWIDFAEYDLDVWQRWFNWDENVTSWTEVVNAYLENGVYGDTYDQMMEPWRYSAYGGAVYCEFASNAKFIDCIFENNQTQGSVTGEGGLQPDDIVPWPDRQLTMPTGGGAVFAIYDCDLEFTNCVFSGNVADSADIDLPHTYQSSFGGAVGYKYNCDVKFTDCVLEENNATVGGGIYTYESGVTVTDCNVVANEAYYGGGLFLDEGTMAANDNSDLLDPFAIISNSLIHRNVVDVPDAEIILPENPDDEPIINESELEMTGMGAGLLAVSMDLSIFDTAFFRNESGLSGGGLMLMGTVAKPANIFNCLFADNLADADGAGASVKWNSQVDFRNCTFADNSSAGGFTTVPTGEYIYDRDDDDGNPIFVPETVQGSV